MELRRWVGVLAVLVGLSGCGTQSVSNHAPARDDEVAVKEVLAQNFDALYDGDGDRACSYYTSSYRRAIANHGREDRGEAPPGGSSCEQRIRENAPLLKRLLPGREWKVIRITVRGDSATAVSQSDTTRGKTQSIEMLVRQDGEWKIDRSETTRAEPPPAAATSRRGHVGLVPLDQVSQRLLLAASRSVKRRYGVEVRLLPRIDSGARTVAPKRGQLSAEKLVRRLTSAYPKRPGRRAVIGVTNLDIFMSQVPEWAFTFGTIYDEGHAVLSTARMDPINFGKPADAPLVQERVTKMVTRYVGELYFRLPRSDNPRSALRSLIRSDTDIDAATDAFCPARPAAIESC